MLDLKQTGLDIQFDTKSKKLILEGSAIKPSVRKLKDMKDVVMDTKWLGNADPETELYYMYRDIAKKDDRKEIEKNNLRYDITIIPPNTLSHEYTKTAGHTHPLVPDTGVTYTELYEVINGEGLYLMQSTKGAKVLDAYFVKAKAGEKIIIPPGYAHITINTKKESLIMSNWVARSFSSAYDSIRKMRGGAYYVTADSIIKNASYANHQDTIKYKSPSRPDLLGLKKKEPIYSMIRNPCRLAFLTEPQNHKRLFSYVKEAPAPYP